MLIKLSTSRLCSSAAGAANSGMPTTPVNSLSSALISPGSLEPMRAVFAQQLPPPQTPKRFGTKNSLRKMESPKLRSLDEYEKPKYICLGQWLRTATREWFARQSINIVTRFFGANNARLIPHLDSLAELQHRRRFIDDAECLHARALSLRENHFGHMHPSCAINLTGQHLPRPGSACAS